MNLNKEHIYKQNHRNNHLNSLLCGFAMEKNFPQRCYVSSILITFCANIVESSRPTFRLMGFHITFTFVLGIPCSIHCQSFYIQCHFSRGEYSIEGILKLEVFSFAREFMVNFLDCNCYSFLKCFIEISSESASFIMEFREKSFRISYINFLTIVDCTSVAGIFKAVVAYSYYGGGPRSTHNLLSAVYIFLSEVQ